MWLDFDVRDNRRWTFSLKEALLWIMDVLLMDLFQLLSSKDVNWWTGVLWITCGLLWCFYQLFGLSFWRHPFTAETVSKLILISDGLRVSTFTANVHFWVNYSFKWIPSNAQYCVSFLIGHIQYILYICILSLLKIKI